MGPVSVLRTTVSTAPGFCTLRALTTWKTSTTPSILQHSMVVAMAQNIPERLTVSLQKGKKMDWTVALMPKTDFKSILCSQYFNFTTSLHIDLKQHRVYLRLVYLQCTTMGWLPVLIWTLVTSSMTSVIVFRLLQLPSGSQFKTWNWITWCAFPLYKER